MNLVADRHDKLDSAAAVVAHVRELIDRGALRPGGRLPPERDLARQVGVRDVERARRLMHEHLLRARSSQAREVLTPALKVQAGPRRKVAR